MIHMTNTWPLLPPAKATMTTIYSALLFSLHSKHWNPFVNPTTQTPNPLPCPQGHRLPGLTALPMLPSASAATFCLICPHRGPVSQASQAHFCPKASRSLYILASKAELFTMVPLPENIWKEAQQMWRNMKKEACGHTEEKREASKRHRLSVPSKPTPVVSPSAMAFWSGPLARRTCQGLKAPFLSASPCSCQYCLGPALHAAGSRWLQSPDSADTGSTASLQPPQKLQHPSQGPSWGSALTGPLHQHCWLCEL